MSAAPRRPKRPEYEIVPGSVSRALAAGLEDLIHAHYVEVDPLAEAEALNIDWEKLMAEERLGLYRSLEARCGGKLVGYAGWFVQPAQHHRHRVWALGDVLYVDPPHRGRLGVAIMDHAEGYLRGFGVTRIIMGDRKVHNSTPPKSRATLGLMLTRKGYKPEETVYSKPL